MFGFGSQIVSFKVSVRPLCFDFGNIFVAVAALVSLTSVYPGFISSHVLPNARPPHFLFVQQPSNYWAFLVKVFAVKASMAAGPIILCFTSNKVRIGEFLQLYCNKVFKNGFVLKTFENYLMTFSTKTP